eukprot:COSAG01_NODE_10908_length_2054_cov_1.692583_1_plen_63_part_00
MHDPTAGHYILVRRQCKQQRTHPRARRPPAQTGRLVGYCTSQWAPSGGASCDGGIAGCCDLR